MALTLTVSWSELTSRERLLGCGIACLNDLPFSGLFARAVRALVFLLPFVHVWACAEGGRLTTPREPPSPVLFSPAIRACYANGHQGPECRLAPTIIECAAAHSADWRSLAPASCALCLLSSSWI